MARNLLTARAVQTAKDGDHSDGDGLRLQVRGDNASWVFRFTSPSGKRREQGLGAAVRNNVAEAGKSLTTARDLAEKSRKLLREKIDPIEHSREQREKAKREAEAKKVEQQAERHTVARVARAYYEEVFEPKDEKGEPVPSGYTEKHSLGWIAALERHVPKEIWHKPISDVTYEDMRTFVLMIRRKRPEAGKKVTQRLRKVFSRAERKGLCRGNPVAVAVAAIKDDKIKFPHRRKHFAALPWQQVPAFIRELRTREAIAARALLFGVYTLARTGEIIGATWDEFHDLDGSDPRWIIPADRMKADREHVVPLSPQAVAILREQRELGSVYVFPSPESVGTDEPAPLSNMAMLTLLRRMDADKRTTVHGLCRGSASTWANENNIARADVIELALAHEQEGDESRKSYNHARYLPERRALLLAWADFVDGKTPASNVVPLQRAA